MLYEYLNNQNPFSILPQAILVPELPLGWVVKSFGISWIIITLTIGFYFSDLLAKSQILW